MLHWWHLAPSDHVLCARTTSHKLPQHWQLTNLKIQKASMTSAHGRLHLLHMSGGCLCPSLTQAALSAAQLVCSRKGTVWTSTAYVGQKTVNFWTGVRRPVAIKTVWKKRLPTVQAELCLHLQNIAVRMRQITACSRVCLPCMTGAAKGTVLQTGRPSYSCMNQPFSEACITANS